MTNSSVPVAVTGLSSGVAAIAAGAIHACALTTGGAVRSWGYNDSGELGNNSTTDSSCPCR
jgi:alpha-tubulin suppressor-like RCC1 family protein